MWHTPFIFLGMEVSPHVGGGQTSEISIPACSGAFGVTAGHPPAPET